MGIVTKTEVVKTVVTTATDDLTGNPVDVSELTEYPFKFGDVNGTVALTASSLAQINALPEFAALIKAANENKVTERTPKTVHGAYGWERRAVAKALGISVTNTGGALGSDAEAKFADAVTAGYPVNGAKTAPKDDAMKAFNAELGKFVKANQPLAAKAA